MRLCLSSFRVGAAHVVGPALQRTGSRGPFDGDHHFVMLPWCYHKVIQYQSMYDHIYIYNIHTLSWCVPFSIAIVEVFFDKGIFSLGEPAFFHPQVAVEESLRWEKRKLSSNVLRSRRAGRSSAGGHPSTKRWLILIFDIFVIKFPQININRSYELV